MLNAVVSYKNIPQQFVRNTGERVLFYACSQVCIVSGVIAIFNTYRFIVKTMRKEEYIEVLSKNVKEEMELGEFDGEFDDDDLEIYDQDESLHEDDIEGNLKLTKPRDSTANTSVLKKNEKKIIFANSYHLRQYVFNSYVIGIFLFWLVVALDLSHQWVTFTFAFGFYCRWCLYSVFLDKKSWYDIIFLLFVCVLINVTLVWILSMIEIPLPALKNYPFTAPFGLCFLFLMGFMWASCIERDIRLGRSIIEMSLDAQYSVLLMAFPLWFVLYRQSGQILSNFEVSFSSVIFVWIFEPLVKFLCVCVFILSIRAKRFNELVLVLAITVLFQTCVLNDKLTDDGALQTRTNVISMTLFSILIITYIGRSIFAI